MRQFAALFFATLLAACGPGASPPDGEPNDTDNLEADAGHQEPDAGQEEQVEVVSCVGRIDGSLVERIPSASTSSARSPAAVTVTWTPLPASAERTATTTTVTDVPGVSTTARRTSTATIRVPAR